MYLPLSFRVVELTANESEHRVVLRELQRPMMVTNTAPRGPEVSPAVHHVTVSRDQFSQLRIGQVFDLEPSKDEDAGLGSAKEASPQGSAFARGLKAY